MATMTDRASVVAVFHRGKVLLLLRPPTSKTPGWCLPGGMAEFSSKSGIEPPDVCALRELYEETGQLFDPGALVDHGMRMSSRRIMTNIFSFTIYEPIDRPEIKVSPEHDGYAWVAMADLDHFYLAGETRNFIVLATGEHL